MVKNFEKMLFGMIFNPNPWNRGLFSLDKKYLAYLALLAGWLIFCYWLYAKEIYPQIHQPKGTPWPEFDSELKMPLAFKWGSDIPIAGANFEGWVNDLRREDSLKNILVLKSYFFRDESRSIRSGKILAAKRAQRMIRYLELSDDRVLVEILPATINEDVRIKPFAAVHFESIAMNEVYNKRDDTLEICFPLKDSLSLPKFLLESMQEWLISKEKSKAQKMNLTGTADGTGISESADLAWDRAIYIQEQVLKHGWQKENIFISTEQRSLNTPIRNRCVVAFFEN